MAAMLFWALIILLTAVLFMFYYNSKSKKRTIIASILMAVPLAICAYNFVPNSNYDLVRHHNLARKMAGIETVEGFVKKAEKTNLELLPQVYSLLVGKTGDLNIMQALAVLAGYGILFYILLDYRNTKGLKARVFLPLLFTTIFGQHILYYFSGLYNYLGINIMALAMYLYYMKGTKMLAVILCVLSLLIHNSMLYPIALWILFIMRKEKVTIRFILFLIVSVISLNLIMDFAVDNLGISMLDGVKNTYGAYVEHNEGMIDKYDKFYMVMTVIKTLIVLLACWMQKDRIEDEKMGKMSLLIIITMIAMAFSSIAITRFSSLAVFVAIPTIANAASSNKKVAKIYRAILSLVGLLFTTYSLLTIYPYILIG